MPNLSHQRMTSIMACTTTTEELAISQILERFTAKYGKPIDSGLDRIVFDASRWVIKVPRSSWCYGANYTEASYGHRSCKSDTLAICRLFHIDSVPVLWMEKVEPVTSFSNLPDWTNFIDCQQVGYTRKGKLVAYDYGNH